MAIDTINVTRKRLAAACAAAAVLTQVWAAPVAAELKIGYIDSQRVLGGSKMFQQARTELERYEASLGAQAEQQKQQIESLQSQLEVQRIMLTEERRTELEDQIRAKMEELQTFVNEVVAPQGRLAQKSIELNKPIFDKVQAILDRIGAEEGYDLIFDTLEGNIVFASPELDLTDRVIEELARQEKELGLASEPDDTTAAAQPAGSKKR